MKYIKYLISFLLIFGLTVNECSIYSRINAVEYHQVSYVNIRKGLTNKHSKMYACVQKILSEKVFIILNKYRNLQEAYSAQSQTILKLRIELFQAINSMIVERAFLNKIFSSCNQYSSLYIA